MDPKISFMRKALANQQQTSSENRGANPAAPVGTVVIGAFADFDYYYLNSPIGWYPEGNDIVKYPPISVPKGFVTDLASIPSVLWSIMPPTSTYTHATIIHDFLYWYQPVSRKSADNILKIGMKELNVSGWRRSGIFRSLRMFGGLAWNKNLKRRKRGEKRILAKLPDDPRITWNEWKRRPDVFAP